MSRSDRKKAIMSIESNLISSKIRKEKVMKKILKIIEIVILVIVVLVVGILLYITSKPSVPKDYIKKSKPVEILKRNICKWVSMKFLIWKTKLCKATKNMKYGIPAK